MALKGVLIAESLRVGSALAEVPLTVRTLRRIDVGGATADQAPSWTLLEFEAPEGDADRLATALADDGGVRPVGGRTRSSAGLD